MITSRQVLNFLLILALLGTQPNQSVAADNDSADDKSTKAANSTEDQKAKTLITPWGKKIIFPPHYIRPVFDRSEWKRRREWGGSYKLELEFYDFVSKEHLIGMTKEHLIEMLGEPDVVLKTPSTVPDDVIPSDLYQYRLRFADGYGIDPPPDVYADIVLVAGIVSKFMIIDPHNQHKGWITRNSLPDSQSNKP